MPEEPFLVKQDNGNSNRDAGIGNIKYRSEEDETGSSTKPFRIIPFEKREVEHVHYPALHQWSIPSPLREQGGRLDRSAATNDQSIKNGINNIS